MSRICWPRCFFLICAVVLGSLVTSLPARGAESIEATAEKLRADYSGQLEILAKTYDGSAPADQISRIRAWLPRREQGKLYFFPIPEHGLDNEKLTIAEDDSPCQKKFAELRLAQATALMALVERAAKEDRPELVYELAQEVVRENPSQEKARALLGYIKFEDQWRTRFELNQITTGKRWTEKYGWLPRSQVERYEKGERFYQGRWMSEAEESRLRTDLRRGWRIETEHYIVTTNHSLEEGVRLSRKLEQLYSIWRQVFVSYLADDAQIKRWLSGHPLITKDHKQHNVVYYRTREEYIASLKPTQPQIEISLGVYFEASRMAYFFAGEDQDAGTVLHEATHQLFHESRPTAQFVGRSNNFWVVEGVACYMESLTEHDGYLTLGGLDAGPMAVQRTLVDNFYVSLFELVNLSMDGLQREPRIKPIYSESAGLVDFLMHYQQGRYRRGLVSYLNAVYDDKADDRTLARLTAGDYGVLDREYREFLMTHQMR